MSKYFKFIFNYLKILKSIIEKTIIGLDLSFLEQVYLIIYYDKTNYNSISEKTNLLKSKLDKKKAENEATEKLAPKINFASEAKPNYLRESPLNLNNFFEDKLIEQMDPIKHSFLLPMDLHLEASK